MFLREASYEWRASFRKAIVAPIPPLQVRYMAPFRYRDEDSSGTGVLLGIVGAVAGLAVGVLLAERFGGVQGLSTRLRDRFGLAHDADEEMYEDEDYTAGEEDEFDETIETRVLEAFRNDPILSERAVDIGAIGDETIELSGWVNTEDEADHAVTVAGGVPGVATVVNRLSVGEEEEMLDENAKRVANGDPALTEARWEGQRVGTGRRRQGSSAEPDRHADPKTELEERWLREQHAIEAAADDTEGLAERRAKSKKAKSGDRTGGSPVAPTGVPKADHVANPEDAPDARREPPRVD